MKLLSKYIQEFIDIYNLAGTISMIIWKNKQVLHTIFYI